MQCCRCNRTDGAAGAGLAQGRQPWVEGFLELPELGGDSRVLLARVVAAGQGMPLGTAVCRPAASAFRDVVAHVCYWVMDSPADVAALGVMLAST